MFFTKTALNIKNKIQKPITPNTLSSNNYRLFILRPYIKYIQYANFKKAF